MKINNALIGSERTSKWPLRTWGQCHTVQLTGQSWCGPTRLWREGRTVPTTLYPPLLPHIQQHTLAVSHPAYNTETFHLHAHPIKLDALRLVIKGIDPLNLYELQFVPVARPVRGLRKAGTSVGVCACCFAVVKKRGKGFYSSSSELLTSKEEALWQHKQGREGLQRCWWLHANLHPWMLQETTKLLSFVKSKQTQPVGQCSAAFITCRQPCLL